MTESAVQQAASSQSPASPLPRFDIVFLDMDGVLSDFQGAACKLHNRLPPAELARLKHWEPREWDMPKVFGVSKENFWAKIDESPNFWHDMPKTPYCHDVVKIARGIAGDVRLLTTPHGHAECYAGKFEWSRRELSITPYMCREKHLLARPGRLLIDDSDENCDAFRAAGGSAILFPQHWNSAHDKAPFGPLFYLAQELEILRGQMAAKEQLTCAARRKVIDLEFPWDKFASRTAPESPIATAMQAAGDMPPDREPDGEIETLPPRPFWDTPSGRVVGPPIHGSTH